MKHPVVQVSTLSVMRMAGLVVAMTLLQSCGLIQDRSNEYLRAKQGKEIKVPQWYKQEEVRPRYPVPDIEANTALPSNFELPEPPDATAVLSSDPYLIETVEGQTWLHLYTSPGRVWPLLDYFWSEYELGIAAEDITKGYVVTEALDSREAHQSLIKELEASEENPLVVEGIAFQAKLGQGVRRNTAELQVRALRPDQVGEPGAKTWKATSQNPKLEKALLDQIGRFVTSDALDNRYSLLANDIGGESRVRLLKDPLGIPFLELELSFQRAWSEVEQALSSSGVIVSDRDRSERVFYISYLNEEEIDSWFSLSSSREAKRLEQNIALRFDSDDQGRILVRVERLNDEVDEQTLRELINLVFEHIA